MANKATFTADTNGVVYDNRAKSPVVENEPQPEFKASGWRIGVVFFLWLILIFAAVAAGMPLRIFEDCSGPDCVVLPAVFMISAFSLSGMFILFPALAEELRGLRYLTSALLFVFMIDFGLAGTLNAWYAGSHYVVATINRITRQVIRTTEPSGSTFFSLVYLLSPILFLIPDAIWLSRKLRRNRAPT